MLPPCKGRRNFEQCKMITDKLNQKDNTVGLLLNDPSLYNNLNATTANAASLLEDLKSHPNDTSISPYSARKISKDGRYIDFV